jgi:demethylmenaquinone methyltransferase/2-methoxy-6-polyprenyl-1,4-benzoquinol methylase
MSVAELEQARAAAKGDAEKGKYVRGMFSAIAPRYDLLNRVLSLSLDRVWRKRAIAELEVSRAPQGCFLDLCAGTLDIATAIAGTAGFSGAVVGADFAEPMLREGIRNRPAPLRSGAPAPVVADALVLPLATAVFDGAIVGFGIRNVVNLDAALREAHRVIKPRGRFVILEFTTPRNPVVRTGYHAYFHHILPRIGALVSGHNTAYAYLPESVAHFPDEKALASRMERAGFQRVRWQTMMMGIVAIHVGEKA